ncbi:hypothetical protein GCM10010269_29330 [Streptomyces humidus]|uniref:Uncharacterized protein n=1 Tax=Streptomyces humidus TaxID=52259 RepID=A0A918FV28_9ACTN|nr:hypothetical protein GCM10010269_29330 [Streptomyces humidus]
MRSFQALCPINTLDSIAATIESSESAARPVRDDGPVRFGCRRPGDDGDGPVAVRAVPDGRGGQGQEVHGPPAPVPARARAFSRGTRVGRTPRRLPFPAAVPHPDRGATPSAAGAPAP